MPFGRHPLKMVRLPISPLPHAAVSCRGKCTRLTATSQEKVNVTSHQPSTCTGTNAVPVLNRPFDFPLRLVRSLVQELQTRSTGACKRMLSSMGRRQTTQRPYVPASMRSSAARSSPKCSYVRKDMILSSVAMLGLPSRTASHSSASGKASSAPSII